MLDAFSTPQAFRAQLDAVRDEYATICKLAMRSHDYATAAIYRQRRDDVDAYIDQMPSGLSAVA